MAAMAHDTSRRAPVPSAIVLYALLSLGDLAFTMAALMMGAYEVNPALGWFVKNGLFEFAKLSATLLVCCVAFRLWKMRLARRLLTIANAVMICVILYHGYLWIRFVR